MRRFSRALILVPVLLAACTDGEAADRLPAVLAHANAPDRVTRPDTMSAAGAPTIDPLQVDHHDGALDAPASVDSERAMATHSTMRASAAGLAISGTLEPRDRAVLRAELGGPITQLSVRVGDRVRRGQPLVVLAVPALHAAAASAEAQVASAAATLAQLGRERDRVAALLAIGGASRAELDDLEARVHAADAARVAAEALRASARADIDRLIIRSPISGIVERRTVAAGSMVVTGDELLAIVDPTRLELEASVAAGDVAAVRPGARVRATVTGVSGSIEGVISRIAPALDPTTRQLRVTVAITNRDGRLPVGAWADGRLLPAGGR